MTRPVLLPALLALSALAALLIGQVAVAPGVLWQGLVTGDGPGALFLGLIRGPRVLVAIGAGAALGLSGAIFQTLFRNPLAAPDVMGFTHGAGLAVIVATALGLAAPMPLVAAAGGLIAAAAVALLAWRPGHVTPPLSLILVGLGVGFATSSLSTLLLTRLPVNEAMDAQQWLVGSLTARTWGHGAQVWGLGAVLLIAAFAQIRLLAALELGADLAAGLGLRVERARWGIAATGVLLAAAAVAVAGPVPFVALMATPLGSRIAGARGPAARLAAGALAGALVLVLADLAGRALMSGLQFPAGVMTGILGAPYLLWRLSREMDRGEL